MTKVYTFYDDSWYDQPGCSCCGGFLMEAYNSSDTSCNLGIASCLEDCYIHAIKTESDVYMEDDNLWELEISELKKIAKELCIEVCIIS